VADATEIDEQHLDSDTWQPLVVLETEIPPLDIKVSHCTFCGLSGHNRSSCNDASMEYIINSSTMQPSVKRIQSYPRVPTRILNNLSYNKVLNKDLHVVVYDDSSSEEDVL
jgi:hypothetical protein